MEVCSRKTNTAGRLWCEVRSASDLRGPTTWVHAVHVRPLTTLTSGARHAGTTRRRLESNPDDWPPLREPGPSDRRPSGAAQSSSGGHRRNTVAATATRHTHSPLDDAHVAQLLQVLPRTAHAPACTRRQQRLFLCAGWSRRRAIAHVGADLCLRDHPLPANDPHLQPPKLLPPSVRHMRRKHVSRRGERESVALVCTSHAANGAAG